MRPANRFDTTRVRFQGAYATQAAQKNLLGPTELERALKRDNESPYMGEPSEALCKATGLEGEALFKALDRLADETRTRTQTIRQAAYLFRHHNDASSAIQPPAKSVRLGKTKAMLERIGYGWYGNAYLLSVSNAPKYVFKVNKPYMRLVKRMNLREVANGFYFSAPPTKDGASLYAAKPGHWMLVEHISPDTALDNRPGKTFKEQGYRLGDDRDVNRINGIRVDYGGKAERLDKDA